jgi:hypothetical protein
MRWHREQLTTGKCIDRWDAIPGPQKTAKKEKPYRMATTGAPRWLGDRLSTEGCKPRTRDYRRCRGCSCRRVQLPGVRDTKQSPLGLPRWASVHKSIKTHLPCICEKIRDLSVRRNIVWGNNCSASANKQIERIERMTKRIIGSNVDETNALITKKQSLKPESSWLTPRIHWTVTMHSSHLEDAFDPSNPAPTSSQTPLCRLQS